MAQQWSIVLCACPPREPPLYSHLMVFRLDKPKTAEDYFPTADEFTPPPLTPFRTDSTPVEPFSLGLERVPEEGEGVMGVATEGSRGIEMHELHTAI